MNLLALLDDPGAGAVMLETSSALAQALQRDLEVVYVESTRSLLAAALPFTQVLAHAASGWMPLSTQDVEQGFRADAARLRVLAARIALRHKVNWSLRVMRGRLPDIAIDLGSERDLVLVSAAPALPARQPTAPRQSRHRVVLAATSDGGAAGARAHDVAAQLARSTSIALESVHLESANQSAGSGANRLLELTGSDLLVLPRGALQPAMLAALRCQLLLVG